MRARLPALAAAVLLATPALGGDPPVITVAEAVPPAKWTELKGRPNRAVRLTASVPVFWALIDDVTADLVPDPDGKAATFVGPKGRFKVIGVGPTGAELARYIVSNDPGDDPTPPVPGPGPGPTPPPPGPDPFVAEFKAAYQADPGAAASKAKALAALVELYDQAPDFAGDPTVASAGAMSAKLSAAAKKLTIDGLTDLRKAIAAKLNALFPADGPLTDDARKAAKSLFVRIHAALQEVAK